MKKISLISLIILSCLAQSLSVLAVSQPIYEQGATPDGNAKTEYLKFKSKNGAGEIFSLKLRDEKEFPTNNWQDLLKADANPDLAEVKLQVYRVTDGTLEPVEEKEILYSPRSEVYNYDPENRPVRPVEEKPIIVQYDAAGNNPDDHYRIYCVKTYRPNYFGRMVSRYEPPTPPQYIDCSKLIYYYNVKNSPPMMFKDLSRGTSIDLKTKKP